MWQRVCWPLPPTKHWKAHFSIWAEKSDVCIQCLATFLEAKQIFPTGIIRAEPTSLPPGQQCLQWFNQKLEGNHQFYSASYKTEPFYYPILGLLFYRSFSEIKYGDIKWGKKDLVFFPVPTIKLSLRPFLKQMSVIFTPTVHCSFFLPQTATRRLLIA